MRYLVVWILFWSAASGYAQTPPAGDSVDYALSTTAAALTVKAPRIPHGELATERLSQLDIYLNSAAKADPLLAVNTLPAATNPDETANVSLRGSPAAATGVYLNGVPLRSAVRLDQSNGVGQFSIFGQLPLREVRVYPSSPPLDYSQATAGAVAIRTADDRPAGVEQSVSLNLVGAGYSHARPLGKRGSLCAYANAVDLTAFRALNGRKLSDLRASRSFDGMLNLSTESPEGTRLSAFYLGFDERYVYRVRDDRGEADFRQYKPRHLAVLNLEREHGGWMWRANQLVDWEKPRYAIAGDTFTVERTTLHTALHGERQLPGFTLQAGSMANAYFDPSGRRSVLESYVYLQKRLGAWLLGGGVKPMYDGRPDISAQLAARYATGNHRLHLSGGRFRQLLPPGPRLYAWQRFGMTQAALEYAYQAGGWELRAAVYAKKENYAATGTVNVGGAEAGINYEDGPWRAWLNLTSVRSRGAAIITDRDIPLTVRGGLRFDDRGWSVGLNLRGRSGKPYQTDLREQPPRYDPYARIDMSVSKLIPSKAGLWVVYINANNLLDRRNVASYSFRGEEYYSRRLIFFGAMFSW